MPIKSIEVENFKSFKKLIMDFSNFNVLVGANASGKSNFLQILRFIKDINNGLDYAISMQGGIEYLRNIYLKDPSKRFRIKIVLFPPKLPLSIKEKGSNIIIDNYELSYELVLIFKKHNEYDIGKERVSIKYDYSKESKSRKHITHKKKTTNISITKIRNNVSAICNTPINSLPDEFRFTMSYFQNRRGRKKRSFFKYYRKRLLISGPFFNFLPGFERGLFRISIYDFDPKKPKKSVPFTGNFGLEEDGGNLAIVLRDLFKDKKTENELSNILNNLLSFVKGIKIQPLLDKSIFLKLKEKYFNKNEVLLPAFLVSDGTMNIISLITVLYYVGKSVTIIEEPERNIHPQLISKIVNLMRDASSRKQIIVTTHNPEIVRYAGIENLLLISRDENGFSNIIKPKNNRQVNVFLKNQMGIAELFIQGMLE